VTRFLPILVVQFMVVLGCHEAYYKSKIDQTLLIPFTNDRISFLANETMQVEVSHKVSLASAIIVALFIEAIQYSEADVYKLFTEAELRPIQRWMDSASQYSLWLLERPPFMFPLLSSPSASVLSEDIVPKPPYCSSPFGVPCIQDWQNLWVLWDFITRRMIPESMLFQKPIHLRHICLFYLGHIPTFLDIHLSRLLQESHTEPEVFKYIFEVCCAQVTGSPT
jgi:L-histidine Nalpha-methyltransferase / hercynylcysteine S-oxide synthase